MAGEGSGAGDLKGVVGFRLDRLVCSEFKTPGHGEKTKHHVADIDPIEFHLFSRQISQPFAAA